LEFRCETINQKVLWIPCFNNKEQHTFERPSILSEVKISNVIDEKTYNYGINNINQVFNIAMNYDPNIESNFKINPSKADIVLHDSFLIAAINYDILNDIKIPAVMISIINKDCWTKSSNN
jgi:hypothetical protein